MWIGVGVPQLDLDWGGGALSWWGFGLEYPSLIWIGVGVPQLDTG